ncbi:MAG TPA: hypothetical protein VLL52_10065 [Anaerolineae bacterium]|nr:hypothetical protein [Anaerolineae bacterium]
MPTLIKFPSNIRHTILLLPLLILLFAGCSTTTTAPPPPSATPPPTTSPLPTRDPNTIYLRIATYPDNSNAYYIALLEQSLTQAGYQFEIDRTQPLPQTRAVEMLNNNELSLMRLIQSAERDETYPSISVNLTGGLMGQRVFLIAPQTQSTLNTVQTLEDFRALNLVGGFGANWFDTKVWELNQLPYTEVSGEWRKIYGMIANGNRGIDYFSRGVSEIVPEAEENPELAIESQLLFIYERDFRFYLSQSGLPYQAQLQDALQQAEDSGLINELVQEYWASDLQALDINNRTKIHLETPQ